MLKPGDEPEDRGSGIEVPVGEACAEVVNVAVGSSTGD